MVADHSVCNLPPRLFLATDEFMTHIAGAFRPLAGEATGLAVLEQSSTRDFN